MKNYAIILLALPLVTSGCEEETKATPQAIFEGSIQKGDGNNCTDTGDIFTVGAYGNLVDVPTQIMKDGDSFGQGSVGVACSVVPVGEEFSVNATVTLSGATGGLFKVDGRFKKEGESTGIHATFTSRRTGNTYDQLDNQCVVKFTPPNQGVAAGRAWGEIKCPHAENVNAQKTCEGIAQFRFENCNR